MSSQEVQHSERELLLEQLETLCHEGQEARSRAHTIDFLRAYYSSTSLEVLNSVHPPELLKRGFAHQQQLSKADPVVGSLEMQPIEGGNNWLLRCVCSDKPFLVDSLLIAIRRHGASLRWLVHPVLHIRRAADGSYDSIDPTQPAISLIQVEFAGIDAATAPALEDRVRQTLHELDAVVADYKPMRQRLAEQIQAMKIDVPGIQSDERAEIGRFLEWLDADHFTFLGYVESHSDADEGLTLVAETGLGLWRPEQKNPIRIAPPEELVKYASSRRPLIITTTEGRSPIHHDEYCDVVVIKRYDADGNPQGTVRFLGLFSSEVYNTLPRRIPVVRRKIEQVMLRAGLREGGHAAKQLRDILDMLPRDELFESSVKELMALALGVQTVREAQRLRLFIRRDRYGRFYSCLIYQHRERYSSTTRRIMSDALMRLLGGREVQHEVSFQRDGLARTHLIIRTPPGTETPLTVAELESRLQELATRWEDALMQALKKVLPDDKAEAIVARWCGNVPVSYREEVRPLEAATDLQYLHMVSDPEDLRVRLLPVGENTLELKLYGLGTMPSLSLILPRLEQFGLRVLAQHPFLFGDDGDRGWIQHFDLSISMTEFPGRERRGDFEDAFLEAWQGRLEHDGLNALVLTSGLTGREVALVRAFVKYVQQTQLPFSQRYIESLLQEHADFVAGLLQLFRARFNPELADSSDDGVLVEGLRKQLEEVQSLDADRLLTCLLTVVQATLRTNFYQWDEAGNPKTHISLKIRSADVAELPRPRPMVETFVYSPEVEGVHLRGGPVARGGLRWSDRKEDFRTEVLGLVKAQMVKNAVIVPQGAKGGFVVKKAVDRRDRAAWQDAGIACYKTFIRGLLDITDNLVDGDVVPPPRVRRHDGDDPYLVVAADKGTATFSDIANGISAEYGFWLGDAFASGGSAGYDHKKMGITARGAWESVKRHFRELGRDCQKEDFTVVGVGDMAGDVFGNGMLLSPHIRLVAAFNHQHIFIDPTPDAASSFAERKRLFGLPRSSWSDYDTACISAGGGVYERSAKSITLTPEAQKTLGISTRALSPNALIHEILKAPVDLFWNGGIGTYVKSRHESDADVGDRANDVLRIDAYELRAKVIGEGGNLGMTQLARIEAALNGVRVITDFNDNAGGVNSSDREVNLKIPLTGQMRSGVLTLEQRNALLESMTEELAAMVLHDCNQQTQSICAQAFNAPARLPEHAALIRTLEKTADLDRAIEYLPDEEKIAERRNAGLGLTLPEIAVLVSYCKLDLFKVVTRSTLPDDPALEDELQAYFPHAVREAHAEALSTHRLRREIISTVLTNRLVNRMGVGFARRTADEHHDDLADVIKAWIAAMLIIGGEQRYAALEASTAPLENVYAAMGRLSGLLKRLCVWLLAEHPHLPPIATLVETYAEPVRAIDAHLQEHLRGVYCERYQSYVKNAEEAGMELGVAQLHADHHVLGSALDITVLAREYELPLEPVAVVYFELGSELEMPWIIEQVNSLSVANRWQAMARNQIRDETYRIHRGICEAILRAGEGEPAQRLQAWRLEHTLQREHVAASLTELKALDAADSAGLTVMLGQLQRLIGA